MANDVKPLIEEYLNEARLLQVATSRDNQPWACTVYFAFDKKLNIYWISKPTRRHSKDIRKNERVAGIIVVPHTPGDKVRGLQLQGTAKELVDPVEAKEGMRYYAKRIGVKPERVQAILDGTDGHLCYQMKPTLYVLFDEVNFPDSPRQEYSI